MSDLAGILLYAGYFIGAFKINDIVERWPDGLVWVALGFLALMVYLAILVGAWYVATQPLG